MDWLLLAIPVLPAAGAYLFIQEIQLAQHLRKVGVQATGQIVRQRQILGRYNAPSSVPIARFCPKKGPLIEAESASSTTLTKLPTGAMVPLYYDPEQPTRFMFAQELSEHSRYLLLAFALFLFIASGLLVWL